MFEGVERVGAPMPAEYSLATVQGELFSVEWLATLAKCLKERNCVDYVCVSKSDVQMVFMHSVFMSEGSCTSLDDYGASLNVVKA